MELPKASRYAGGGSIGKNICIQERNNLPCNTIWR